MEIEDQVLSIKQVQELQELGFDVKKHSSMYYLPYYNSSSYKIDGYILDTIEKNDSFNSIPTMSIGDIIEILPESIHVEYYGEHIRSHIEIGKKVVWYPCYDKNRDVSIMLFRSKQENLIDSLFDCLVWCIKHKYINLK